MIYVLTLSAFLIFIIICGFLPNSRFGATCLEDSWHYDSVIIVDSLQTVLLIVLTAIIWKRRKQVKMSD